MLKWITEYRYFVCSPALDLSSGLLWQNKILISDISVPGPEWRAQNQFSVLSSSLCDHFLLSKHYEDRLIWFKFGYNEQTAAWAWMETGGTYWQGVRSRNGQEYIKLEWKRDDGSAVSRVLYPLELPKTAKFSLCSHPVLTPDIVTLTLSTSFYVQDTAHFHSDSAFRK